LAASHSSPESYSNRSPTASNVPLLRTRY